MTAPATRVTSLDAVRGLALFGIAQINFPAMVVGVERPYRLLEAQMHLSRADLWVFALQDFFVCAKFYPVFAFLFGYGMALQWQRLEALGVDAATRMLRRNAVLVALGIIHGTFLFFGDILTMYGLAGMVLAALGAPSAAALRKRFIVFLVLTVLILISLSVSSSESEVGLLHLRDVAHAMADLPYRTTWLIRAGWYVSLQMGEVIVFLPSLALYMTLGMIAARHRALEPDLQSTMRLLGIVMASLIIGMPISGMMTWFDLRAALHQIPPGGVADALNEWAPLMAPAWVGIALLWWSFSNAGTEGFVTRRLAAMGRLALTHYVTQSLVMLFLLTGAGLGMANDLSPAEIGGVALLVPCIQWLVSPWYLARFGHGPLEWVWRFATHGQALQRASLLP